MRLALEYDRSIERRRSPSERVSDAEREAVAARLGAHAAAGRIDIAELETRAEAAYRARTVGELSDVLRDLPRGRECVAATAGRRRSTWRAPALGMLSGAGATVVVAHFDGGFRGPVDGVAAVPLWVTFGFAGLLAARVLAVRLGIRPSGPTSRLRPRGSA